MIGFKNHVVITAEPYDRRQATILAEGEFEVFGRKITGIKVEAGLAGPLVLQEGEYERVLFKTGARFVTPAAVEALTIPEIDEALLKHATGQWGELTEGDKRANDEAIEEGFRILSVYISGSQTKFYVLTEANRRRTTIMLPSDY